MHFELLESLLPDYYIKPTLDGYLMSTDGKLFKPVNMKQYSKSFISNLSNFILDQQSQYAVLLNTVSFDALDLKGFFLFIVRKVQLNHGVGLELYNAIRLIDLSSAFWSQFKQMVKHNVQIGHLSLAYESPLLFFLLTNLDENYLTYSDDNTKNLIYNLGATVISLQ